MDRNEAIKIVKGHYPVNKPMLNEALKFLIPELKESEDENADEKVRQALVKLVTNHSSMDLFIEYDIHLDEALSWLKKQGEHAKFRDSIQVGDKITRNQDGVLVNLSQLKRIANKVKPKFKIGDWIIDSLGNTIRVTDIKDDFYVVENLYVHNYDFDRASADLSCHLWSIQYAEPGDVLVAENGWTCIFRKLEQKTFQSYCFMASTHNFYPVGSEHTLDDRICGKMYPATKEQRDLLFQKIHEAGYVWDAEKKKLRKTVTPIFHIGDRIRYKEHKCDGVITEITDTDYICGNTKLPISTQDKLELVE